MIKKIMFKLIVKWYIKYNREIHKMGLEDEVAGYSFKTYHGTVKTLRSALTAQTVRHFEATEGSDEKMLTKGAAMILKIILDAHEVAEKIYMESENNEVRVKKWKQFKSNNKIN